MKKNVRCLFLVGFLMVMLISGCGGSGSSTTPEDPAKTAEKSWVRAHLDDVYLWYNEIVDVPAASYPEPADYFTALLVKSKDRFSFSMSRTDADNLFLDGQEIGFGVMWDWRDGSKSLFAMYVDPNSPAAGTVTRGTELIRLNGKPPADIPYADLKSILSPKRSGASATMEIRSSGSTNSQTVTLVSSIYSITTVGEPSIITLGNGGKVGYLLFNLHLQASEQGLVNAMAFFKQQGVSEVVLDMRHNSGGSLFIAREVSSMLGGLAVQGKVFEKLIFNSKHQDKNFSVSFTPYDSKGVLLPLLGVSRVFVLTGEDTCSASESVINGLLPYLQVVRVGETTCGKPYGMYQANHEQYSYFAIQFEVVNSLGTDDYKSGFAPTCQVADDLNYPLGNAGEARLKAALYYMEHNACPESSKSLPKLDDARRGDSRLLGQRPALMILQ